jgi:hypothetical protein
MVAGPHAVIVRREMESWMPANVRFRDEDHFRAALDRLATHADPVGGVTASVNLFDLKLPNGFRAVGVVPPPALGQPAIASFIRWEAGSSGITPPQPASGMYPPLPAASGSASAATGKPVPGSITTSPRPGSGLTGTPLSRTAMPAAVPAGETDPLSRHRKRIIERLITKLASLGVYDLQQVEITELRRIVAAYIAEYVATEKFYLSDTDQGRLMLEILTAMHR